jgi:hypothetical protein
LQDSYKSFFGFFFVYEILLNDSKYNNRQYYILHPLKSNGLYIFTVAGVCAVVSLELCLTMKKMYTLLARPAEQRNKKGKT